ncbi:6-phosphogluconate dehydrogenase [Roridomyces roridus]|uniref:3-hydroxyisobutyrate dehydrogenase n=1 Tax=Roridomyces roridus TaxID=1738132 RepID=A0AAD7BW35_9AGAR|nr:6-phosphogluconate dehydrogenase [Roridomyces roridus]
MKPSLRCLQRLASRPTSTSFIGLGRMGSEMAYNLFSKQFAQKPESAFVVCDAIPESAVSFSQKFQSSFPGANIQIAATPEEATLASSTIITMLPTSSHVQAVYGRGIIPTLKSLAPDMARENLCIDSTTLGLTTDLIACGASMVDAPASGGVTGAKAATLAFLVGGTEASFQAAHPVLAMMGQLDRIVHCGPSGAGLAAKICNNLILGVHQIVAAEAMILGQKLGLDPAVLSSVIASSTGSCWSISVNNPVPFALPGKSPPCERDYEPGFADMGLASDIAAQTGSPLPLGETARKLYSLMIAQQPELGSKDFSSVYKFLLSESV